MAYAVINSSELAITFHELDYKKCKARLLQIAPETWSQFRILPVGSTTLVDFLEYEDYQWLVKHLHEAGFPVIDNYVGF